MSVDLAGLLSDGRILLDLRATSKRQLITKLAEAAAGDLGIAADEVLAALMERERLGTTAVGHGLAIPHAKLDAIDAVVGLLARTEAPIDFDAADEGKVDLFFALLAPSHAGADHLKALAKVSRVLRDADRRAKLRRADDAAEVRRLLAG